MMVRWLCTVMLALACSAQAATGFRVTDMDGKSRGLEDYRGKWLVVNFWATWCPPCLEEIPDLIALHEQRGDVQVIGIALEYKSAKEISSFAEDNLISYPLVLGDEKVVSQFGKADVLPSTYIYAPDGRLVKVHRGLITRQYIEKLIARQ
jgi:thiol-disulfide isomerase/thioredoxin